MYRRRSSAALVLVAVLLAGAIGGAVAPVTQPAGKAGVELTARDRTLLKELGDPSWPKRKAAAKELLGRGPTAIGTIQSMLAQADGLEAQAQLHAILERLENDKEVGPSLITLHVHGASAKSVYAELFRQAEVELDPAKPADLLDKAPPITLDVDRQPFWTVFQKLYPIEKVGMSRDRTGGFYLRPAEGLASGARLITGPFMASISVVSHIPDLTPNSDKLIALVRVEPKMQLVWVEPQMVCDLATDDHGNQLRQIDPDDPWMGPSYGEFRPGVWDTDLYLQYPSIKAGTKLQHVRASVLCVVATAHHELVIRHPDTAPVQTIDLGYIKLTYEGIRHVTRPIVKTPVPYIMATFSYGPSTGDEARTELDPLRRCKAYDADGRVTPEVEIDDAQEPGKIYIFYTHRNDEFATHPPHMPAKIVWDLPDGFRTIELPLDFKNMDMPYRKPSR